MNKKFLSFSLLLASIFGSAPVQAQDFVDILPPETRNEINKSISNGVNGLVIFSSSSSIGSGYFTFESDDSSDTKMDVLRLLGDYDLVEPNTQAYAPFIRGGVGQLKLTEQIPPEEGIGENDFSIIETFSISGGVGVDIRLGGGFFLTPTFDLTYSHTENRYDYNNLYSALVLQLFDGDVFNWDIETIGYNPGAAFRYEAMVGDTRIIPSATYTQVFVDSFWTNSNIYDVNTSSGVFQSKLRAEMPSGLCVGKSDITIVPQFSRTDIYKDARAGTGIGHYHEVSLGMIAKNQDIVPFFRDFGVTGGYSFGEDFTGWRVGLEAEL